MQATARGDEHAAVGRDRDAGRPRQRDAPQQAPIANVDDRHAAALEHDRRDASVAPEPERTAAAVQADRAEQRQRAGAQDAQPVALHGVQPGPVGRDGQAGHGRAAVRRPRELRALVDVERDDRRSPRDEAAGAPAVDRHRRARRRQRHPRHDAIGRDVQQRELGRAGRHQRDAGIGDAKRRQHERQHHEQTEDARLQLKTNVVQRAEKDAG